ncbi:MAG: hypothetical protein ACJA2R_000311 [Saprospiraceae bacterium]|jgi:hypothetical protein
MSLIPERMLTISTSLAATIGLEEAVLLQALNELLYHREKEQIDDYYWVSVKISHLQKITPFWDIAALQRVSYSLRDKGVLLISSSPMMESNELRFAFNETEIPEKPNTAKKAIENNAHQRRGAKILPQSWLPEKDVLRQLEQYNIPSQFISDQLPEFIIYWSERNEPQFSWGSKFIKHVLRLWRNHQTENTKLDLQVPMKANWSPSEDAIGILVRQAGVNRNFIEDAIPEFLLYWLERGDTSNTWNSRFVMHVKRQWAKFTATMELDSDPRLIPQDWQPSEELYEVLVLANIPRDFALRLSPEFVLYWRESGQAHISWNTKFLQQVKREWSRQQSASSQVIQHDKKQRLNRPSSTRGSNLVDELSDRSWASR